MSGLDREKCGTPLCSRCGSHCHETTNCPGRLPPYAATLPPGIDLSRRHLSEQAIANVHAFFGGKS